MSEEDSAIVIGCVNDNRSDKFKNPVMVEFDRSPQ